MAASLPMFTNKTQTSLPIYTLSLQNLLTLIIMGETPYVLGSKFWGQVVDRQEIFSPFHAC